MGRDFKFQRRAILLAVILLVTADIALAAYSWTFASALNPQQDLMMLTRNRDLLQADILRAQDIRSKIPAIQKDCDEFEKSLYLASTGYSAVSSELGAIARKSGLQIESSNLREEGLKARQLTEVQIEAMVVGSYSGWCVFRTACSDICCVCGRRLVGEIGYQPERCDWPGSCDPAHQNLFPDGLSEKPGERKT